MHEMSIVSSVLDTIRVEAKKYEAAHICKVGLRIGEWSGIDTESLRFCFEVLVTGTDLAPLDLDIDFHPASPHLDIAYFEVEDTFDSPGNEPSASEPRPSGSGAVRPQ